MIVILKPGATEEQIQHIVTKADKLGLKAHISRGVERTIIGFIGPEDVLRVTPLEVFPGVESVMPVLSPYKLVSREFKKENSIIKVSDEVEIGGKKLVVMAGPCSVETYDGLLSVAKAIKKTGANILNIVITCIQPIRSIVIEYTHLIRFYCTNKRFHIRGVMYSGVIVSVNLI